MFTRFLFACLAAFVIFQVLATIEAARLARETQEKSTSQTIDDALNSFKSGVDDLIKNIQQNEIFQNVSTSLKQFGETVQKKGEELVAKIQKTSDSN